ncbi:MAG: hypothetical protein K9G49_09200 [Taibaiella sp.]|nr:hypothetical protein [Taibaiella sp.]
MMRHKTKCIQSVVLLLLMGSCTHKSTISDIQTSGYPNEIAKIIVNKCAISGCHNDLSYQNASGLNLTTWEAMFKGGSTGAVVIPYRPDFSTMCYYTNTDEDAGIILQPTMPVNGTPLSREEYKTIKSWIEAGAPNADGQVKFADKPSRKKFYVANRLCDVATVIDAESLLQMRFIDLGNNGKGKFPYCIKVSPDKKHWYVSFFTQSDFVHKFSATDDKLVTDINLGLGMWTSFAIASDSKHAWFVDNSSVGKVVYANLQNNTILATYSFNGNFKYPKGIALDEVHNKLYVGTINGNFIYRIDITDPISPIISELPIDTTAVVSHQTDINPDELLAAGGKCYIICVASGELRVLDMAKDSLLAVIPLGSSAAVMAFSTPTQQLFVSCPDDMTTFPGNRGAVLVMDAYTNQIIKKINTGYQPYGIAIDEERELAMVVNANISSGGPASHHKSGCGEKNGNVTFIELNSLKLVPGKKLELVAFPFSAACR